MTDKATSLGGVTMIDDDDEGREPLEPTIFVTVASLPPVRGGEPGEPFTVTGTYRVGGTLASTAGITVEVAGVRFPASLTSGT